MDKYVKSTFKKEERIRSTKLMKEIFERGYAFNTSLFRVIWLKTDECPYPARVVFSVPKKSFRLAVDRNLIKRRMREAYRIRKHLLYRLLSERNIHIAFFVIYRQRAIPVYRDLENSVEEMIEKFDKRLNSNENIC